MVRWIGSTSAIRERHIWETIKDNCRVRVKSRKDIEAQYKRIINDPTMYKERYDRVTEARQRYMDNIYRTRRSQSDRKRIRMALKQGGADLDKAMADIMERKYSRNTYMGLNTEG